MSAYPRPIHCVDCQIDFRPEKNGVWLIELFQHNAIPYSIWAADLWKCPKCGIEIVSGYSQTPTCHHEEGFLDLLEIAKKGRVYYNYPFTESKKE